MKVRLYRLESCTLEVEEPIEIGRATGHFWFPSLHPMNERTAVCGVVRVGDKPQGVWRATLFISNDVGRSWKYATEGSYGPSSVPLSENEILVLPFELRRLEAGHKRATEAEGSVLKLERDGSLRSTSAAVRFLDFPFDLGDYYDDELMVLTNGNVLKRRDGKLLTTLYGKREGEEKYDVFAVVSDDGGFTWRFLSVVARGSEIAGANEGADESNTVRLKDGRLMCVFRTGSGQPYYKTYSPDDGASWTKPEPVAGAWSVEPQLLRLPNELILLSDGRQGLFVWVCTDGEGKGWERFNLAEHHNSVRSDLHYEGGFCEAKAMKPPQCTSYTGMALFGDDVLIVYERLANGWNGAPGRWGEEDVVFSVRMRARM